MTSEGQNKKRREEYEAQAMLLGLQYDGATHTMWGTITPSNMIMEFDADTLKLLTRAEMIARADRYMEENGVRSVMPEDGYRKR